MGKNNIVDSLAFDVLVEENGFDKKLKAMEGIAKKFNITVSEALNISSKADNAQRASQQVQGLKKNVDALNDSLKTKTNGFVDIEAQAAKVIPRINELKEKIDVINAIRVETGGRTSENLSKELKEAEREANRLINSIEALERAQKGLNRPDAFNQYISGLSRTSTGMQQLIEYYKAEEQAANRAAKARNTASKAGNGGFKEYVSGLSTKSDTQKQMSAYYKELEKTTASNAKAAEGARRFEAQQRLLSQSTSKANANFTLQGRALSNLTSLFTSYVSIFAVERLVSNIARVRGEFELQQVALRAIIQDAQAADTIFSQIKGLAIESPFQFKELTGYVKQLAAFSIETDKLFDTTSRLADISAGLGVDMGRIILAYGQVRSASVLRGQELRQFTEAGIPLVDQLAKKFGELEGRVVSAGEVFEKISNRQVSFGMVDDIFSDLTSEGGMFFEMQAKQAETLAGKLSNLKDAYEIMLNGIGEANEGALKGGVDGLRSLMENWENISTILMSVIILYGSYKAAMLAVNATTSLYNKGLIGTNALENIKSMLLHKSQLTQLKNIETAKASIVANAAMKNSTQSAIVSEAILNAAKLTSVKTSALKNTAQQASNAYVLAGTNITRQAAITEALMNRLIRQGVPIQQASAIAEVARTAATTASTGATVGLGAALTALYASNPVGWILAAVAAIGTAIYFVSSWESAQTKLNNKIHELTNEKFDAYTNMAADLQTLIERLKATTKGSADYYEILSDINNKYSEYLPNIDAELNKITALEGAYDKAAEAIKRKMKAEALSEAMSAVNQEHSGDINTDMSEIRKKMEAVGISTKDANAIIAKFIKQTKEIGDETSMNGLDSFEERFRDIAKSYLGEDTNLWKSFDNMSKGYRGRLASSIRGDVDDLGDALIKKFEDVKKAENNVDAKFSDAFNVKGLNDALEGVKKEYDDTVKYINGKAKESGESRLETELKIHKALIDRQKQEAQLKLDFGEIDQAKFEAEIAKINKPLSGAKQVINEVIDSLKGLSDAEKHNFKIKGDSTSSVQEYIKSLQEQKEQLEETIKLQLKLGGVAGAVKLLMAGGTGAPYSADTIIAANDVIKSQTQLENYTKVLAALKSLITDKDSGSGKDAVAEKLKNQIDLLKKAEGQFEKYLKIASKSDAIKNVLGDAQFKSLGVDFKDYSPADTRKYLDQIYNSIKGNPRFKEAKELLDKLFSDRNYDDAKKTVDDFLAAIQSEIETYKSDFDFYKTVLGITGDKELSANIAFNATGTDVGIGLVETLKKKLQEATKGEFSFDDLLTFSPEKLKELPDGIQKMFEETRKTVEKSTQDSYISMAKLVADSVKKFASSQQQIEEIQKDFAGRREAIVKQQGISLDSAKSEEEINAINKRFNALLKSLSNAEHIAILKLSDNYMDFFSAINSMTIKTASDLRQKLRAALYESFRIGTLSASELRKELKAIDEQFDKLSEPQGNFAAYLSGGVDKLLKKLRDTGNQVEVIGQEISKMNSIDEIPEEKMKFLKSAGVDVSGIFNNVKGNAQEAGKAIAGMGSGMSQMAGQAGGALAIVDMIVKGIDSTIKGVRQVIDQLNEVRSDTEQIDAGGFFEVLEGVNQYVTSAWSKFKSGDWVGAAFDSISSIIAIFTGIAKRKDKEMQESIEESEKKVKRYENAYKDLERAMNKALGDDKFKEQSKLIDNLGKQMSEVAKQAELERSKKGTDTAKVDDLERQYIELQQQIEDLLDSIKEDILGSAKDIAQELGDALFEAFANGTDAAEAWGAKVDEIIGGIIKKMIISTLLEKPIGALVDKYAASFIDKDGNVDREKMMEGMKDFTTDMKELYDTAGVAAKDLWEATSKELGLAEKPEAGEGLKESIKGVTEDTASLLASYLNAIRQHIVMHGVTMSNSDRNIAIISAAVIGLNRAYADSRAMVTQGVLHLKNIEANTFNTAAEARDIALSSAKTARMAMEIAESSKGTHLLLSDVVSGIKKLSVK